MGKQNIYHGSEHGRGIELTRYSGVDVIEIDSPNIKAFITIDGSRLDLVIEQGKAWVKFDPAVSLVQFGNTSLREPARG